MPHTPVTGTVSTIVLDSRSITDTPASFETYAVLQSADNATSLGQTKGIDPTNSLRSASKIDTRFSEFVPTRYDSALAIGATSRINVPINKTVSLLALGAKNKTKTRYVTSGVSFSVQGYRMDQSSIREQDFEVRTTNAQQRCAEASQMRSRAIAP